MTTTRTALLTLALITGCGGSVAVAVGAASGPIASTSAADPARSDSTSRCQHAGKAACSRA
jgi:hypothetical protein